MRDLISRRAAIDALDEIRHVLDTKEKQLTILPSAQPERKTGRWGEHGECPYCGYLRQWEDDNFCANCGARMGDINYELY